MSILFQTSSAVGRHRTSAAAGLRLPLTSVFLHCLTLTAAILRCPLGLRCYPPPPSSLATAEQMSSQLSSGVRLILAPPLLPAPLINLHPRVGSFWPFSFFADSGKMAVAMPLFFLYLFMHSLNTLTQLYRNRINLISPFLID